MIKIVYDARLSCRYVAEQERNEHFHRKRNPLMIEFFFTSLPNNILKQKSSKNYEYL